MTFVIISAVSGASVQQYFVPAVYSDVIYASAHMPLSIHTWTADVGYRQCLLKM